MTVLRFSNIWTTIDATFCVAVVGLFLSCFVVGNCFADTLQKDQPAGKLTGEQIKEKSFGELFKPIAPKEIPGDVFTLVNKDYTVLTGGTAKHYNSMIASWGGWGTLFEKPVVWGFMNANRYTLELIRKDSTYTMSYFDNKYKEEILLFGKQSGRTSDKMKNTKLTAVQTPSGNITYKEAKIIIECKLFEITTVAPDDFKDEEARKFIVNAQKEVKDYHKVVFGVITNVWIRK
ncbi:MAG: flavin reductase [Planctomycetaceae bacterium]|jgi:flavin reductase (DIM6/NTAB) family NADH-FMN oxidoreductase RutF|nr:flavin reductase [Planctomycetaceae bacterium]